MNSSNTFNMLKRDKKTYSSLLRSIATLSGLFSKSEVPYIDSRFVEKLFVVTAGARDIGRQNKSFDALLPGGIGVGIKTFIANTGNSNFEKVAEFTALASEGIFRVSNKQKLANLVANARNQRILSNAAEYGIDIDRCVYHCLVRFVGGACVHEEPYRLINTDNLTPLTSAGRPTKTWGSVDRNIFFSDGQSDYCFSLAKNVLMKRFEFDRQKNAISLTINQDPLALLHELTGRKISTKHYKSSISIELDTKEDEVAGTPGEDYVYLPLYSIRDNEVHAKSGINQWNAGGRQRRFGEAYIPIPALIHKRFPNFFPERNKSFVLQLPNGFTTHTARVCQDGGKALMTENNADLGHWIISVIDPKSRHATMKNFSMKRRNPFTYDDLVSIGSDSVLIERRSKDLYSIRFANLNAFRKFELATR